MSPHNIVPCFSNLPSGSILAAFSCPIGRSLFVWRFPRGWFTKRNENSLIEGYSFFKYRNRFAKEVPCITSTLIYIKCLTRKLRTNQHSETVKHIATESPSLFLKLQFQSPHDFASLEASACLIISQTCIHFCQIRTISLLQPIKA